MNKVVEFLIEYDTDCRLRERFVKSGGIILEFAIQLEINTKGKWIAIRRWDTAHGFIHCDIIYPDGRIEKQPIPAVNYNEGLTIAEYELRRLWRFYRDEFLMEVKKYESR